MNKLVVLTVLAFLLSGCAIRTSKVSTQVSKKIEDRTGHGLNPNSQLSVFELPPRVSLADGLTDDEAVAIALWNNAAFQADLTALGFARADLVEAGQLRNPILTLLLPWGPKQLEATANLPVEVFWQRPRRVAAAKVDLERVAESLVQTGLNLVRDVRLACADLALANSRARIAGESRSLRGEIARIVQARLRDGDISELETSASRIDAQQAEEQAKRFAGEIALARDRLRFLLGMATNDISFDLVASSSAPVIRTVAFYAPLRLTGRRSDQELSELIRQALVSRPDVRAAELAIEAAGKRAKWERSKVFSLSAILDANAKGSEGFESGPGFQAELPIFNRNRGGITRAEAEIDRASRQYLATRHRVVLDVREAYNQYVQSRESLDSFRQQILPQIEEEIHMSNRAYEAGEAPYIFVLETSRKRTDARLREAEAAALLRRATAQLERAVGRRVIENS